MKIIFSRKGFDSGMGGVASPIFPSGALHSIPIPESFPSRQSKRYREIRVAEHNLGAIVQDLTGGKIDPERFAHLDPDLDAQSVERPEHWRPVFGQAGAAEKHLQNQGVKEGDVFLFYGWFRQVEYVLGKYRYVRGAPNLHVIFGWLQIEQRLPSDAFTAIPLWAHGHPHCKAVKYRRHDSMYLSTSRLHIPGTEIEKPGAGRFPLFNPQLRLTAPNHLRSVWQLPAWFVPRASGVNLSYHSDPGRWKQDGNSIFLRTVGRGQEFVLDTVMYPEAVQWLCQLLRLDDTIP